MKKIAIIGGKGGIKKTTLARLLTVTISSLKKTSLNLDIDQGQSSYWRWSQRRAKAGLPEIEVFNVTTIRELRDTLNAGKDDFAVIDGAAYRAADTQEIAEMVDLTVIPTSFSTDDVESAARLAKSLVDNGIPAKQIAIAFFGVLYSPTDYDEVNTFFTSKGYYVVPGYVEHKLSYQQCQNFGRALNEVQFPGLAGTANRFANNLLDYARSL